MIKINEFDLGRVNPQNSCKIKGTSFLYYHYKTCFLNKQLEQFTCDLLNTLILVGWEPPKW